MSGPGDRVAIRRALLSVADKTGLADLARALAARNVALLSTGSTAAMLRQAGLAVTEVADITGVPEMMDGRVKTLHPRIHGGLLARRDADSHNAAMAEHGIPAIDLLVSNLYPFEQRLADGAGFDAQVEEIDIGGPAMTRSAAKNHDFVTVLSDPAQYDSFLSEFSAHDGATSLHFRRRMAQAAFARTAAYDSLIQAWLARQIGDQSAAPRHLVSAGRLVQTLRYGENPHQTGALYADPLSRGPAIATARQVQGRELSWNNIADADAAFQLAAEFARHHQAACTIVKHANPSGVALADSSAAAYLAARAADPDSAYGGIIAFSRPLDEAAARAVTSLFAEVVVAPAADDAACAVLAAKPNLRLLLTGPWPPAGAVLSGPILRSVSGGWLAGSGDHAVSTAADLRVATRRRPDDSQIADLLFAFTVAKHVRSNAIVLARDGHTVGIGAGQMSRVDSVRLAVDKSEAARHAAAEAAPRSHGAVLASDAFFPFADGLQAAADAGVTAVIQPGGSLRDEEVIAAADAAGLAMVMTGVRHFRH